ncbi:MAG: hypothetical protein ACFCVG_09160 [Kineosporiaceae bacterium]
MTAALEAQLLAEIDEVIRRIEATVEDLRRAIDVGLQLLPPFLDHVRGMVLRGWERFVGFLGELWNQLREMLENPGSPSTLSGVADEWTTAVGGPVSAQIGYSQAGQLLTDDRWEGLAADAYRQNLPVQKAALGDVSSILVEGLRSALDKVTTAIWVFWGILLTGLAALVAAIIGALATSATVIGLPAGPFIAAGGVLALLAAIRAGHWKLEADATSANLDLLAAQNNNSAYPGGRWPEAVTP